MGGFLLFKLIGTVCHAVSEARKPYLTEAESCRKYGLKTVDQIFEEQNAKDAAEAQKKINYHISEYNKHKEKFLSAESFLSVGMSKTMLTVEKRNIESVMHCLGIKNKDAVKRVKINVDYLDDDFVENRYNELKEKAFAQAKENDKKREWIYK